MPAAARAPGPTPAQPGIDGSRGRPDRRAGDLAVLGARAPTSTHAYNHYSLLGTIEDLFGLPRLGYARTVAQTFGADVFNAP